MNIISDAEASQILKRMIQERVSQKFAARLKVANAEEKRDLEKQIQEEAAAEFKRHRRSDVDRLGPVIH